MDIRISASNLRGKLAAPPSKSAAHRAAICAALAGGESLIANVESTKDMLATIGAAKSLGARAELNACVSGGGSLSIAGIEAPFQTAIINCGESGSTLRFFVPVAAALGVSASFRGEGRLSQRPMDELIPVLESHGIKTARKSGEILSVSGRLTPGVFEIGGSVSSQYITGLLFALPLLDGDSEIILTSPLQSSGYVDMTVSMQRRFGVSITETPRGYRVAGKQRYAPRKLSIEGDYSNAAFWFCAGALGGSIGVTGLDPNSKQGDRRILKLLTDIGARVEYGRGIVTVSNAELKGFDADVSQIPDLMPVLSVTAAFCNGVSTISNASRLRLKESDRIASVAAGLRELGASVIEHRDGLEIIGAPRLRGDGTVSGFNDHRIAMSMSVAASCCRDSSVITGADCVDKSYPGFYRDFALLGGIFNVV